MTGSLPRLHWQFQKVFKWGILLLKTCVCVCVCVCVCDSTVSDSATPWTVAPQAPLSMEFSRQEHWTGLPFPSSGDLPDPQINLGSFAFQEDSLPSEPPGKPKNPMDQKQLHLRLQAEL